MASPITGKIEILDGITIVGNRIDFAFSICYSSGDAIPLKVMEECFKGINKLLKESSQAFEEILLVDNSLKRTILVDTILPGCKLGNFVFSCFLGSNEEAQRTAQKIHARFGVNKMLEGRNIQNIAVAAIVAYGIATVAKTCMPKEKSGVVIEATNSIVMNVGRDLNMEEGELDKILDEGVDKKLAAGRAAVQAMLPASQIAGADVKIGGENGILIPRAVLRSLPDPSEIDTRESPKTADINDVLVTVIAGDRQKSDSGWAIELPEQYPWSGKRIKAKLDTGVLPGTMMYKEKVTVDLTVYYDTTNSTPRYVLIRQFK
jgi:hypothetical protein